MGYSKPEAKPIILSPTLGGTEDLIRSEWDSSPAFGGLRMTRNIQEKQQDPVCLRQMGLVSVILGACSSS